MFPDSRGLFLTPEKDGPFSAKCPFKTGPSIVGLLEALGVKAFHASPDVTPVCDKASNRVMKPMGDKAYGGSRV